MGWGPTESSAVQHNKQIVSIDFETDFFFFAINKKKWGLERIIKPSKMVSKFVVIEDVVMLEGKESHWILIARRGWREPESGEGADVVKEGSYPRSQLAIHKPSFRHFHHFHSSREPISSDSGQQLR
jgi:hypothetical protein